MNLRQTAVAIASIAALFIASESPSFAGTAFTVGAQINTIGTVNMATTAYTFTSSDNTNAHLPANEDASITGLGNITGSIRTTKAGTGIISVVAPAGPLVGAAGATIPIANLQATCAVGTANTGVNAVPSGLATLLGLTASASIQCAKYNAAATGTSAQVGILMTLFLDDTTIVADTYAALSGFSVTASAT